MSAIFINTTTPGIQYSSFNATSKQYVNLSYQNLQIISVTAELYTSAVVGNRQLRVNFGDNSNNYARVVCSVTQPASTNYLYCFAVGVSASAGAVATMVSVPIPPVILPLNFQINVFDAASIDTSGDQLYVRIAAAY